MSPDTFVIEEIWTLADRVKVVEILLLEPVRAALTVTCPTAEGENVTVVCVWPCELVVVEDWLKVAAPAGETVQATLVFAMVTAPVESVTFTTSGAEVWPGLMLWLLPLTILMSPGLTAVTAT